MKKVAIYILILLGLSGSYGGKSEMLRLLRKLEEKKHKFLPAKGFEYNKEQIKPWSHYYEKLKKEGLRGNSRVWGDASEEVQRTVIDMTVYMFRNFGFSDDEIAFTLCLIRNESGFNPDAASNHSASGLAQFIDRTRYAVAEKSDLITDKNNRAETTKLDRYKFNAAINILLLKEQIRQCLNWADKRDGDRYELAYCYHFSGGNKKYIDVFFQKNLGNRITKYMPMAKDFI